MSKNPIYVLGGYQTDFAKHWSREGSGPFEILQEAVNGALEHIQMDHKEIQTAHISNFVGELFCGQGHMGGLFSAIHPDFYGVPAARHEAACASGSIAVLAASAELEAGRYDVACVAGVEQMRNVPGQTAAEHLGAAAWVGQEAQEATYLWPYMFSVLGDVYDERFGLKYEHLMALSKSNFENAKRNPNAQTRKWSFGEQSFTEDDEYNPVVEGRIRRQDCAQITDGAAAIILVTESYAKAYANKRGISLDSIPKLLCWGHKTVPLKLATKLEAYPDSPYIFPHVRDTVQDAFRRAGLSGVEDVHAIETHDCFTTTQYMAIDHFGITEPGKSWQAIEEGKIQFGGEIPMNPSGGLMGVGHPVGASGIRMVLDGYKQTTGTAGDYQVEGARRLSTLNIGGSTTTCVSFVVGHEE